MSREIEFRQFKNGEMHHFGFICRDTFVAPVSLCLDMHPVMQFTGRNDIDGKRLFEGDLVQIGDDETGTILDGVYEIKWHEEGYFYVYQSNCNWYNLTDFDIWLCGNIYQNQEMSNAK